VALILSSDPSKITYDNPQHYATLEMCIPRAEQLAMTYSWNKYLVARCVQKTEMR
jgi:hypothetical protein